MEMLLFVLLTTGPACWALLLMFSKSQANRSPLHFWRWSMIANIIAMSASVLSLFWLALGERSSLELPGTGQAFYLIDAFSVTMGLLISFIGWVILMFSRNYLDGNPKQGQFIQWLGATLGSVFVLVISGHLLTLLAAWISTSLSLHQLLIFNSERRVALISARKKFVFSRIADLCLILAAWLLYQNFQTLELPKLLSAAKGLNPDTTQPSLHLAVLFLAFGAILKSAQFPFHTWLPDTLETPTPVSALMHAGIISAGGFLLIRMSPIVSLSPISMRMLIVIGTVTAIFGSLVMLTQTSVKKSLAFSTVAQMGYMILQCGLGAFGLAALHLVAHSLYKAHTFLSSGSVVSQESPIQLACGQAEATTPSPAHARLHWFSIVWILGLTSGMTLLNASLMGVSLINEPSLMVLGGILTLAVATLILQTQSTHAGLMMKAISWGWIVSFAYFGLHGLVNGWLTHVLPQNHSLMTSLDWALQGFVFAAFVSVFILQIRLNQWQNQAWAQRFYVLALNRFYVNAFVNRLLVRLWPVKV